MIPSTPDSPSQALDTFRASERDFVRRIVELPEELWLTKIVNWTPRDVVAHLIGWNILVREGCDLLRAGKAPAYLDDREHSYRHVNDASVKRHAAQDRWTLLAELETSFRDLERYLAALDPVIWDADTGVRVAGRPVTIRNSVRVFGRDYDNHRRRLEEWQAAIHP